MTKPIIANVQVMHLKTLLKGIETLQDGREKGLFNFSLTTFNDQEIAIKHIKCSIATAEGNKKKKRNTIRDFNIISDPETQKANAERNQQDLDSFHFGV